MIIVQQCYLHPITSRSGWDPGGGGGPTLNDSPQPHAAVAFGFVNTNSDFSLLDIQSISVPTIYNVALGSTNIVTSVQWNCPIIELQ